MAVPTPKLKKSRSRNNSATRKSRTGRVPKGKNSHMKSPEATALQLNNEKMAMELKLRGASYKQIAEHMTVDVRTAKRYVARGLEEYFDSHSEVAQRYKAFNLARTDQLIRTYFPRALGGTRKDKDPVSGQEVVTTIDPDAEAAKIALYAMRDQNRMLGAEAAIRVEHTGKDGGPIETSVVDAMDAARAVREAFGGAAAKSMPGSAVSAVQNGTGNGSGLPS